MKSIIIYHSLTGQTEKVAQAVQAGVQQATGHCDLVKIKDASPRHLSQYDLIGLGSPCSRVGFTAPCPHADPEYHKNRDKFQVGLVPMNVEDFIKGIMYVGGKHAFVFNTHPIVPLPGYFFPTIVPMLKKRGLTVIGMKEWYVNSYLPWDADPYPTAGHPDALDLQEAESFGKEIVERSRKIGAGETKLIPKVPRMPQPQPQFTACAWETYQSAYRFHPEKCWYPRCQLCMDHCPVDGIDLSVDPPVIGQPCEKQCAFCTMVCPTGALEMEEFIRDQFPQYLRIQREVALPILARAEAKGKFRRLLPVEKVGLETPFYQKHNQHPQWVIGKGPQ
jgi:Fe-S-cluster-containing hydrogenase component 2